MNAEKSRSVEIPNDWVKCLVVSDMDTLNESDPTKGRGVWVDPGILNLGEARISRKELADPALFETQILRMLGSSRPPILDITWMNQEQSDRDDAEKPERDRAIAKKREELRELFSHIQRKEAE